MDSMFLIFFNGALSIRGVLLWKCFNSKKPASESLIFNKFQSWSLQLYEKRDSGTGIFLVILWNI